MRTSRSARVMLLYINGQSRGPGVALERAVFFLLFVIIVAILNYDRALAVFPFQSPLVGGEDVLGFIRPDHLDVLAHEAEGVGEVADVLELRMKRAHGANAGPDDYLGPVAAVGHEGRLVEVVDHLVNGQ